MDQQKCLPQQIVYTMAPMPVVNIPKVARPEATCAWCHRDTAMRGRTTMCKAHRVWLMGRHKCIVLSRAEGGNHVRG